MTVSLVIPAGRGVTVVKTVLFDIVCVGGRSSKYLATFVLLGLRQRLGEDDVKLKL
jgi:hypothetical protein